MSASAPFFSRVIHRTVRGAASLFLVLLSASLLPAASPNVVLVMCDDLGWGDVGFSGNSIIQTPHLDAMAANALKFERFYAAAPGCSPTRGSALTGRHPYRYGIYFANTGHMEPEELTLAEALRHEGYATGHFGKWHLGTLTKTVVEANRGGPRGIKHFSPPQDNGFDVCFSTESKVPTYDPMKLPKTFQTGESRRIGWDALDEEEPSAAYNTHYWDQHGKRVTENLEGDDSRVIMDRAVPFIEQAVERSQPFFAVVWFHTPHLPVVAGPADRAPYQDQPLHERNYYGCITAMDRQVGRLRQTLRAQGVSEQTMVFFCSDNGPEGNDKDPGSAGPFRGRKRSLYEGGVRVPALLEWPAMIQAGRTTKIPAVTSDYLPTVLDYLGVPPTEARDPIDGISLRGVIEGTMAERPLPIGFQSKGTLALSDNRFKLMMSAKGSADPELYDLLADPGETTDVAAQHPEITQQMMQQLRAFEASCKASDQAR
jgi:arylsulfatase A-like enzyme